MPALVIVADDLVSKVQAKLFPFCVILGTKVREPYIIVAMLMSKLGAVPAQVVPVKSTFRPIRGISWVIVWPDVNADAINTSSWQSGTLLVHLVTSDQLPPLVPCQVWVAEDVKVTVPSPPVLELPKQSPIVVEPPLVKSSPPASFLINLMSRKSAFVNESVAPVIVKFLV